MAGINRMKILFIMFFIFIASIFPQEKQADTEKKLREEILAVYQFKGEQGICDFFKKQKEKISNRFIVDFADAGLKKRKEEWLKICEIMAEEKKDEKTLADVLFKIGTISRINSNYDMAFDYYDKALKIYEKTNDLIYQGKIYLGKSDIYLITGKKSKVIDMCDKALPLFERKGNLDGQGHVFLRKGDIYFNSDNKKLGEEMYEKALDCFEKTGDIFGLGHSYLKKGIIFYNNWENLKALTLLNKAMNLLEKKGDSWGQSDVCIYMASIYSRIGESFKAIECVEKARYISEECGSFLGQGNAYGFSGDIYSSIANNSKALEMYNKALYFFEKGGSPWSQGNTYMKKGSVYLYMGDNSKASELLDKALNIFKKLNNPTGQGDVYIKKGAIYSLKGDNSKALVMYNKALDFYKIAGNPLALANLYVSKGDLYLRTCNYLLANMMYKKAMLFYEKSENPLGKGNVYLNEGYIYFLNNDFSKALEMYDKALSFYKKAGDPISLGNLYKRQGDAYFEKGNNLKALKMYEYAQDIYSKAEHKLGICISYEGKGDVYFNTGDNLKAAEFYDKSIKLYSEIGEIEGESDVLHKKARVLVKERKIDEARTIFKKGISKLEKFRIQNVSPKMKINYMGRVYNQYKEVAVFMLKNKNYEEGFKYTELLKARVFLEQLSEGFLKWEKGIGPDLKKKRDIIMSRLSILSKQIQEVSRRTSENKSEELRKQYLKIENDFEELLINIRIENPLYASVNYPQPVTVRDLQTDVLKKGETLLSYFISPGKAYAFIVSRKNFRVKQLKVKENEINSYIERYLHSIKENNTNDVNRFGGKLYEKLFKSLEKYLKKSKEIIIVPPGKLETIPFESLIIGKNKSGHPVYLLDKYRIKYLQSASLLSFLRKHYRSDSDIRSFIGFGDPVYDYENFKQGKPEQGGMKILATESTEVTEYSISREGTRSDTKEKRLSSVAIESEIKEIHRQRYARAGGIMDRLPHSGEEIQTIARLFEKNSLKSVVHLREQAAEENAKAVNMKDFDYIHFSCHGLLNDDFQSLVLSQLPPEKSKEDGYFTLNEIMNCDYNAKLVVLSACETGSGKMYKGEGVTGLTRAVMYAGTPAVIASLWKVDDIATKELMVKFYRNLLEKKLDKTEALRQAKLELLKNKNYSSPLFWSAFVMYGE